MKAEQLAISDVILFSPKIFSDDRGFFYESFNNKIFEKTTGLKKNFVQDNHSKSTRGVLRGLHYQLPPKAQGKLVRVIQGEVFDVVVDIRKNSPTFGRWIGEFLSCKNKKLIWIPEGCAHGFLTLTDTAEFLYKTTEFYAPEYERCITWNCQEINIQWPLKKIILSPKDEHGKKFSEAEVFAT